MKTYIRRWGNSLALRIPKALALEIGLGEDAPVELTLEGGRLVIVPIVEPSLSLDQLIANVTDENRHGEIETGAAGRD